MNKSIRYALIGATGIGGYHLSAIRALEQEGQARLMAVADPALSHATDLRDKLTQEGTNCYLDHRTLLREELGLDAIVISVPIPLHFEIALECLARGLFVYLEKPPVPLIQQLEALISADKNRRICVGFQMISADWSQKLKQVISEGKLGAIQDIRLSASWPRTDAYYRRNSSAGKMLVDGKAVFDGPATNALAHLVHNAMYLAGDGLDGFDTPTEIQAELYHARPIESYDIACFRAKFQSGLTLAAALTHATEAVLPFQIEVRGTKGWGRISQDGAIYETSFGGRSDSTETFEKLIDKMHRQFLAYARGEAPRFSTMLRDTRGYVLATNAMLLSSGGIHPVAPEHVRHIGPAGDGTYDVAGLYAAVNANFQSTKLFSEMGLPWAVTTPSVPIENLRTLSIDYLCSLPAAELPATSTRTTQLSIGPSSSH